MFPRTLDPFAVQPSSLPYPTCAQKLKYQRSGAKLSRQHLCQGKLAGISLQQNPQQIHSIHDEHSMLLQLPKMGIHEQAAFPSLRSKNINKVKNEENKLTINFCFTRLVRHLMGQ